MGLRTTNYQGIITSKTGTPCVVRRTWTNKNSTKDQVTVQFIQVKERTGVAANSLSLQAQGVELTQTRKVTNLMTFSKKVAESLGLKIDHDYTTGEAPLASSVFGKQVVNIECTESEVKNPFNENQECVANPNTGEPRLVDGKMVYLHTELVERPANDQFINSLSESVRKLPVGLLARLQSQVEVEQ